MYMIVLYPLFNELANPDFGIGSVFALALYYAILFSPALYFFLDRQDDFGAGEPLSPKKREAWRKRKAQKQNQ